MIHPLLTLGSLTLYLVFLLGLGYLADKNVLPGKKLFNGAFAYSMSLAVYCTTWTFYGSIGNASNNGLLFATIYLGPVLGALLWWPVLRRIIRIKNTYRITSIIDFISARYNKSTHIGAVLTAFVLVGFIPYNALQLKSIMSTTGLMMADAAHSDIYHGVTEAGILTMIILFTILFGLRRLDPSERHPGMMSVLAIESGTKLLAAVAGGIFVVYFLSDGVEGLVKSIPDVVNHEKYRYMGGSNVSDVFNWITWLILAGSAVIFLPRQFHIAVIENADENHLKKAQWSFPLYLLIVNLFVLPIAIYGLKNGFTGVRTDSLLLELPLVSGEKLLALFIYIGGFSAGIGMITVSVMTITTMATNHLLLPIADRHASLSFMRRHILKSRWVIAAALIVTAYLYQKFTPSGVGLVAIGMISFVAAFQFVPPILMGLFWSKANSKGALIGIVLGCATWLYTLFLPAFFTAEMTQDWMAYGPFGIHFLRPQALFGIEGLTSISHAFLWTSLLNVGGIFLGSIFFETSREEEVHAEQFLSFGKTKSRATSNPVLGEADVESDEKKRLILNLLNQYFDQVTSEKFLNQCLEEAEINSDKISVSQLANLNFFVERSLAAVIGSAAAHYAIRRAQIINDVEEKKLTKMFAQMLSDLQVSPIEFKKKVDFHIQKQNILKKQKDELEINLAQRMKEVQSMQAQLMQASKMSALGEMAGGIAHEINTPLAIINLTLEQMQGDLEAKKLDTDWALGSVEKLLNVTNRIATIIKGLRSFSKSGDKLPFEQANVKEVVEETLSFCKEKFKVNGVDLKVNVDPNLTVECRSVQLSQVVLNLLNNAFDAIQNYPTRWIQVEAKGDRGFVEIAVTDSGSGIPAEAAQKIMQPFFTTKGVGKGVGLGLSISKGIVEDHQGQLLIDVKSPNTKFIVRMPVSQSMKYSA